MATPSIIKILVIIIASLTGSAAWAEPPNYGVTHGYSVHLARDFVNQELVGEETLLGDFASVAVAYGYYQREKNARRKDGKHSLDSRLDQWLPVAALVLQYTVPEYTDFIYSRTVQVGTDEGEPMIYFTLDSF